MLLGWFLERTLSTSVILVFRLSTRDLEIGAWKKVMRKNRQKVINFYLFINFFAHCWFFERSLRGDTDVYWTQGACSGYSQYPSIPAYRLHELKTTFFFNTFLHIVHI